MGRPSGYKPEFCKIAQKMCELGATDEDVAQALGVSRVTLHRWQTEYSDFCSALKAGKAPADERVERSLYHRATGYTFDAVKIFPPKGQDEAVMVPYREHVPPDTTACIFWLKNRRPDLWRDKQHHEHTGKDGGPIEYRLNDEARSLLEEVTTGLGPPGKPNGATRH